MTSRAPPVPALLGSGRAGGLRLALVRYPPGLVQPRHAHAGSGASLVLSGAVHEEWGAGSFTGRASSCVHKPGGAPHATRFGPEGALILSVAGSGGRPRAAVPHWASRAVLGGDVVDALLAFLLRAGDRAEGEDAASEFLAALDPAAPAARDRGAAWLADMYDRLAADPAGAPSVAALARRGGVDPAYASRAFRDRFGIGPLRHRRRARCWRALDLLLGGAEPAAAAAAAGFADQSHLTRELRARFGTTPGAIRRGEVKKLQDRGVPVR